MPGVRADSTLRMDTNTIQEAPCSSQEAGVEIESRSSIFITGDTGENQMILW